ncbi:SagB family peptide dehydrogenase [Paenibacillus sp. 32O-W]|uniref:SagB family peptide dehydrogenase n=1 Tax=Paenibacillus sp. 32O-W TaxID=1695218 RepID=UPI00119CDEC2|nr:MULTISPECIES: SagB family peptide dehydrogenase [Paenibacillaceae]
MNLDEFVHQLQKDTDKVRPPDWEVDWADAPLPYKLYRGLPAYPLFAAIPLNLEKRAEPALPDLCKLGHFLWYVFGLTQFSESLLGSRSGEQGADAIWLRRRFAPSGGALYPNELYLYLKTAGLPIGVYHYDAAHHRLVLLREGLMDCYLARALGHRSDLSACFGAVFLSVHFWKNVYKYSCFAYRLHGLDTGVVIGQLLETAERFGFVPGVYLQFLDRAIHHLLGLKGEEESVYAVIPLSSSPSRTWFSVRRKHENIDSAAELCRELPAIQPKHYGRSRTIKECRKLVKMNEASWQDTAAAFRMFKRGMERREAAVHQASAPTPAPKAKGNIGGVMAEERVELPVVERLSYDLAAACRRRSSPDLDFVMRPVSLRQLAALLQEAAASLVYAHDLNGSPESVLSRISIYGCLKGVEGVADGAYQYDPAAHALTLLRPGDHRLWLQQGMTWHNVNLSQVPLCLHVVGDKDHLMNTFGYRGYRIQQMEAGMLVQRLLLAASALGLGGHPLLGYDVNLVDEIYFLARQRKTSLIQVPIGAYRPRLRLTGGLHG